MWKSGEVMSPRDLPGAFGHCGRNFINHEYVVRVFLSILNSRLSNYSVPVLVLQDTCRCRVGSASPALGLRLSHIRSSILTRTYIVPASSPELSTSHMMCRLGPGRLAH